MWKCIEKIGEWAASMFTQSDDSKFNDEGTTRNTQIVIGKNNNVVQTNYNGVSQDKAYKIAEQAIKDNTASDEEVEEMLDEVFGSSTTSGR